MIPRIGASTWPHYFWSSPHDIVPVLVIPISIVLLVVFGEDVLSYFVGYFFDLDARWTLNGDFKNFSQDEMPPLRPNEKRDKGLML